MKLGRARSSERETNPSLHSRRLQLRPLVPADFAQWQEVRLRNRDWLEKWEPSRPPGGPDVINDRHALAARCNARERERHLGTGFGFGVFVDASLCGEMNLSSVQRGPFQNCYVGYWIDERMAGRGYTPEALVAVLCFAFEELRLHRVQIAIIPRNLPSRRVVEKLDIRNEGVAVKYLEIDGEWEDHMRFAVTIEEWRARQSELSAEWL
ncbi:MAG: GNAT family N-acetyltransferase [Acidimicrobiales bacterium]